MTDFDTLYQLAVANKGSVKAVESLLLKPASAKALAKLHDDRYLSTMAKCVFRAGFVWKVIDNKWPGFEEAFGGFNPLAIAHYSDDKLEELATDTRIVRNLQKITAVRDNANFMVATQSEYGSFANMVANWPEEDIVGLWLHLKKHGSRLGGNSGPMVLRIMGKDTFILTTDVANALLNHGFMDKVSPTSKASLSQVQQVFIDLREQSNRPFSHISKILALSV